MEINLHERDNMETLKMNITMMAIIATLLSLPLSFIGEIVAGIVAKYNIYHRN